MDLDADEHLGKGEAMIIGTLATPNPGAINRDLILRAARMACSEEGENPPDQTCQSTSEKAEAPSPTPTPATTKSTPAPISAMLADMLVQEGLTVHERPLVQYTLRSSVPRVARQVCVGQPDAQKVHVENFCCRL